MFRAMRRFRQQLSAEACGDILHRGTSGVLSLQGDDGYPYGVPVSYVYDEAQGALYFHCAKEGHKLDALRRCDKVSFCVIDRDQIVPQQFTTYYRSVILFGRARVLNAASDGERFRKAINLLALKYAPEESQASRDAEIENALNRLCMVEIIIDHMTGKQARELM